MDVPAECVDDKEARKAFYESLLPVLRIIAREHGYALAIHGSLTRDFDIIAVPWIDAVQPAAVLIETIRKSLDGFIVPDGTRGGRWDKDLQQFVEAIVRNPSHKPHGRLAWNIHLTGGLFLDVSVMPQGGT